MKKWGIPTSQKSSDNVSRDAEGARGGMNYATCCWVDSEQASNYSLEVSLEPQIFGTVDQRSNRYVTRPFKSDNRI